MQTLNLSNMTTQRGCELFGSSIPRNFENNDLRIVSGETLLSSPDFDKENHTLNNILANGDDIMNRGFGIYSKERNYTNQVQAFMNSTARNLNMGNNLPIYNPYRSNSAEAKAKLLTSSKAPLNFKHNVEGLHMD